MKVPCAVWHDVTILAPWALYMETGDSSKLAQQYNSMTECLRVIQRNKTGAIHLWDPTPFQLGVRLTRLSLNAFLGLECLIANCCK
jgi:alpha-L-rhamnosidase